MGEWDNDLVFRRVAEILWPADFELATMKRRGHAQAHRVMQHRFEGMHAMRNIARLRMDLDALIVRAVGSKS
jgi:hypothetical protein